MRGTSRSAAGREAIAARGIEPAEADPDRVGTIVELVGDVSVVAWLLGSGPGEAELEALHGPRLERVLEKLVDTPVRGFVYEPPGGGTGGGDLVEAASRRWHIPVVILERGRGDHMAWASELVAATERVIGSR